MYQDKKVLRRLLRERRQALSSQERTRLSTAICRICLELPSYVCARSIGIYSPTDHEVDPAILMGHAMGVGKRVALPVTQPDQRRMDFVVWRGAWEVGPWGILQPKWSGRAEDTIALLELDVLFVPLVGFDRLGYRLGYGGGYFDRFLAGTPGDRPCLIGLAYGCQEVDGVPVEPHDLRLHQVVTEDGVLSMGLEAGWDGLCQSSTKIS
ncbi:MAG: 5-formyltetrahydrofolate cyclo-ligase [Magnetococcales bacterium]|nr:5-formyltetrahydrofolate cyclo-ligase [Magnetococcales bacterium]